jgi:hypothetical protein
MKGEGVQVKLLLVEMLAEEEREGEVLLFSLASSFLHPLISCHCLLLVGPRCHPAENNPGICSL